jgi:hypothetical protein
MGHRGNLRGAYRFLGSAWNITFKPNKFVSNSKVFWVVTPCRSQRAQRFGGTYRLHLQDHKATQAKNLEEAGDLSLLDSLLASSSTLKMECKALSELHRVTTPKTAVRTSDPI